MDNIVLATATAFFFFTFSSGRGGDTHKLQIIKYVEVSFQPLPLENFGKCKCFWHFMTAVKNKGNKRKKDPSPEQETSDSKTKLRKTDDSTEMNNTRGQ